MNNLADLLNALAACIFALAVLIAVVYVLFTRRGRKILRQVLDVYAKSHDHRL